MSWENIYKNPRRISPGIRKLNIPIVDNSLVNIPNMFMADNTGPIPELPIRHLELNRYQSCLHMSYDALSTLFEISGNSRNNMEAVKLFMNSVSREAQNRLETMQPISAGHPVIIDRVTLNRQDSTYQIIIHIDFWAIQLADVDLGRAVYERTLHELISGNHNCITIPDAGNWTLPHLDPLTFHRESYDVDAEENAHKLLREMITEKQFELYKLEGYVIVKGTYGRIYKVNKNNMIDVLRIGGGKEKNYRLCIEPRDSGTICPTDEVIAKIKLIQSSEKELHKVGIKWSSSGSSVPEIRATTLYENIMEGTFILEVNNEQSITLNVETSNE